MPTKNNKKLIIVDISSWIFRAFYAIRPLNAPDGTPTNAVHGVTSMLLKLFKDHRPTHLFLARDSKGSFRNELYEEYKANRSAPPDELIPQFGLIKELMDKMKIPSLVADEYEADDIIGSLALQYRDDFDEILIASGDKDLMQLIGGNIKMLDTMKGKLYDDKGVYEKMGVRPDQIVDYLSMVGDSSDNIPGMRGIGAKGAAKLLAEHDTFEECIKIKDTFKGKKLITAFSDHLEEGLLSKKLISLVTDIELKLQPDDLSYQFTPSSDLYDFLENLGMKRKVVELKELELNQSQAESEDDNMHFQVIDTDIDKEKFKLQDIESDFALKKLQNEILKSPYVSLFPLFDSNDFMQNKLLSLGVSLDGHLTYSLDAINSKVSQTSMGEFFKSILDREDIEIFGHELKLFLKYCFIEKMQVKSSLFDIAQVHYNIDPSTKHDVPQISENYTQYTPFELDVKGHNYLEASASALRSFVSERAGIIFVLADLFKNKLAKEKIEHVYYDLDGPLIRILSQMEYEGVLLNPSFLDDLNQRFSQELQTIETQIFDEAGEELNLRSPKQISELLFEKLSLPIIKKTKTGASTDSEVLEELDSRGLSKIPRLILNYRELEKLNSTYVMTLPKLINSKTGRIHTSLNQNVASTGRLSSDKPNLQNIPVRSENGKLIRKAFIAQPGKILLAADYSQVELRILAHMSGDTTMLDAFKQGIDIHARTASEVLGMNLSEIGPDERSKAKAVNFGLMYGQSSFGLAKTLRISRKEAKEYITMYFERFHKVKSFLDSLKEKCEVTGYAETDFGRKRYLPDIKSTNRTIKSMAERVAVNSPIQGTAADIIKKAMIDINDYMRKEKMQSTMILQVHDELIFEVVEEELSDLKAAVKKKMEGAASLSVPLTVDMGIGVNWFDLK